MTKNTALTAHLHSHPACNLVHWVFIQYRSDQIGVLHTAPGSGLQTQNKVILKSTHTDENQCADDFGTTYCVSARTDGTKTQRQGGKEQNVWE